MALEGGSRDSTYSLERRPSFQRVAALVTIRRGRRLLHCWCWCRGSRSVRCLAKVLLLGVGGGFC
jgi:hypothetical protein